MGKALTLLLTRPAEQSRLFLKDCEALAGRDLPAVISPVIEPEFRNDRIDFTGIQGLILTSANAARALRGQAELAGCTAYCVGDKTARAAEMLGCRTISAKGSVDDLFELICARAPTGRLMYLRGQRTRGELAARLSRVGFDVEEAIVYDMVASSLSQEARDLLSSGKDFVAPVFSPESARLLAPFLRAGSATGHVVAISEETGKNLDGIPQSVSVCSAPNSGEMSQAVVRILG